GGGAPGGRRGAVLGPGGAGGADDDVLLVLPSPLRQQHVSANAEAASLFRPPAPSSGARPINPIASARQPPARIERMHRRSPAAPFDFHPSRSRSLQTCHRSSPESERPNNPCR